MGKSLKYKVGDKVSDWTIESIDESHKNISYNLICKCGTKKEGVKSNKLSRLSCCRFCYGAKESNHLIGQKFGRLLVLSNERINGIRKLKVRCDCGKEYFMVPETLKMTGSCRHCAQGNFPGKIVDDIEFIQYVGNRKWQMKCFCGNVFEKIPKKHKHKLIGCGCVKRNLYIDKIKEKIGYKFGLLKVISYELGFRHHYLICKCKCGNKIRIENGREPKQNSCGCLKKINVPKAEKKGNAKFKNHEILSIREFYQHKIYSVEELAKMFNCGISYIYQIVKGFIWKSLPNSPENLKKRYPKKRGLYKKNLEFKP